MASPERNCEIFPSVQSDLSLIDAPYRIDFDAEKFGHSLRNSGATDERISSLSVILTRRPEEKTINLLPNFAGYSRDTNTITMYGDSIWAYRSQDKQSENLAHEARHTLQTEKMKKIDIRFRALGLVAPMGILALGFAYGWYELADSISLKVAGIIGGSIEGLVFGGIAVKSMVSIGYINYVSPLEHGARRYAKRHKEEYAGILSITKRDI